MSWRQARLDRQTMRLTLKLLKKQENTTALMRALQKYAWPVIEKTATEIERRVKTTAPYRTGNLRRSYHVQLTPTQLRAQVGSDPGLCPYAPHVEFGTSTQKAQPHLGPAGMSMKEEFASKMREAVRKALAECGGKPPSK